MKDDTETKADEPAKKTTATGSSGTLLYRVVKVPEGKRCLRVKIGSNGWRFYPGHQLRLTQQQAAKVDTLCQAALEVIPEL